MPMTDVFREFRKVRCVIFQQVFPSPHDYLLQSEPGSKKPFDVQFLKKTFSTLQGCLAVAKLLCVPPLAVLSGILSLLSFAMAHAEVHVPNTKWTKPGILWLAIGTPTGT